MKRQNRCPDCGRSRGSMTHKTKCLGKSRGAERAKARARRANRRAGLCRIAGNSFIGHTSSHASDASATFSHDLGLVVGIVANADFFGDRNAARQEVPA